MKKRGFPLFFIVYGGMKLEDPRIRRLARLLVEYSVDLEKQEKVLVEMFDNGSALAKAVIEEIYRVKAKPFLRIYDHKLMRTIISGADEDLAANMALHDRELMKDMDAYIGIRSMENASELSDIPESSMETFVNYYMKPVLMEERVPNTKWVVMRYPNDSMAQLAKMSTESFENFYFDACLVDYSRMEKQLEPLKELMKKTERVTIKGPGTDLEFSIKDIPVIPCHGKRNIPDGEVFTAPVRESVNGTLSYNTPSSHNGFIYENITFEFRDGKIVKATANNSEKINNVLDTDEGARYIGEFSLGVNPRILHPMMDTLFDEKIAGSFHMTPGNCYEEAPNGNSSAIHWDLVCIQRKDYGGGDIYFDDVLVRKDGLFVTDRLMNLNPDRWEK
jgi:aminopeptidase